MKQIKESYQNGILNYTEYNSSLNELDKYIQIYHKIPNPIKINHLYNESQYNIYISISKIKIKFITINTKIWCK